MNDSILDESGHETVHISATIKDRLLSSARWAKFLGIVGFCYIGLYLIMLLNLNNQVSSNVGINVTTNGNLFVAYIFVLIICVLIFFPSFYLFQYSRKVKEGLMNNSQLSTEQGIKFLSRYFSFVGVLVLILIILNVITILAALV